MLFSSVFFGSAALVFRPERRAVPAPAARTSSAPFFAQRLDVSTFQRGNIHTHSTLSDGDHAPREVYAWSRDHGYAFVALTDHNLRVDPSEYRDVERPGFVIIPGEEITMSAEGVPVHVNGLCTKSTIRGEQFPTKAGS